MYLLNTEHSATFAALNHMNSGHMQYYMTKTTPTRHTLTRFVERFYRKTVIHLKLCGEYFVISDDSEFVHTTHGGN